MTLASDATGASDSVVKRRASTRPPHFLGAMALPATNSRHDTVLVFD